MIKFAMLACHGISSKIDIQTKTTSALMVCFKLPNRISLCAVQFFFFFFFTIFALKN